ncbi:MAG: hypothetical protein ACOC35_11065, partial [Promethearchaeia archaeon]
VNNYHSFEKVEEWVNIIRKSIGNVPLILLGTKNDLEKKVSNEEIFDMVQKHRFHDLFFTSIKDPRLKQVKKGIFRTLIQTLRPKLNFEEIELVLPEQDDKFKHFAETFQKCIICGERNHMDYLKKFYFSKDHETKILKEKVFEILDKTQHYEKRGILVQIGIPCCSCFKKYFSDLKNSF